MNGWGPFCAFFSSVTWAVGSSNYSKITRNHSAFTLNFTRAVFALPCFLIASLIQFGGVGPAYQAFRDLHTSQVGWFFASVVASYGIGDAFFLWSSQLLGVPGSLAIASIFPIWTALAAYFFHGEILNFHQYVGLFIVVGGVVTVIISEDRKEVRAGGLSSVTRGVLFALVSSLFWAVNSYTVSKGGFGTSAFVGNATRMAMALPMCRLFAFLSVFHFGHFRTKGSIPLFLPLEIVQAFSWVFVLEAFGGSFFFVYGLSHSPLSIAATLTSLAPVLSVPVALALKIERYSLKRVLGVCLVVIGLCLLVGTSLG